MKISDVCGYAIGNLKRHKLRTALTCAGVAVGVSTLVVMVSLGAGLEKMIADQLTSDEFTTRITVRRAGQQSPFDMKQKEPEGAPITSAVVADLSQIEGVVACYPDLTTLMTIDSADNSQATSAYVIGLPTKVLGQSYQGALKAGRYWTSDDGGKVCVLPSGLASELGYLRPEDAVGTKLGVCDYMAFRRYREEVTEVADPAGGPPKEYTKYHRPEGLEVLELDIIGVYDTEKFGYMGMNVHIPLDLGEELYAELGGIFRMGLGEGEYRNAIVKVRNVDDMKPVREEIEKAGFETTTIFDILKQLNIVFMVFKVLLGFFGGIGLVVAFFGIANTMFMAVLERTREIGVLKALGARNADIRRVFFVEAGSIGLGGGALGVGFGWLVGVILNSIALSLMPTDAEMDELTLFYVPLNLVLVALGVSTAVALVAGIYPAWRAARQDPVVALRRE